jgi:hypothetical protein
MLRLDNDGSRMLFSLTRSNFYNIARNGSAAAATQVPTYSSHEHHDFK